ncbi:hypothetical protein B0H66DRAFT_617781 [Apodospora peruviana]|uniref:Uncharacterized protein n=1 Tax=Apodospora peruviana TaxID=516989 RepID=A0AAE0ILQ3_9PEZI|nr:hypothetical protein B0H66DRAFT_617781 [Apodospora peruviana]
MAGSLPREPLPAHQNLEPQNRLWASAVDVEAQPVSLGWGLFSNERGRESTEWMTQLESIGLMVEILLAVLLPSMQLLTSLLLTKEYQLPHTTPRASSDRFLKLLSPEQLVLCVRLWELSDREFGSRLSEYMETLTDSDVDACIDDLSTSNYEDLIGGRYRSKATNLTIPKRFDYCSTYQEYIGAAVEELDNRRRLHQALERAYKLVLLTRKTKEDRALDSATLTKLKTRLVALQGGRDYSDARPPHDRISANLNAGTIHSTLNFIVPTCCVLSCIPAFLAWRCSPPQAGTTSDPTFYELLTGFALQAVGLGTTIWPALSSTKLASIPQKYTIALAVASAICMAASAPMYFLVSSGWGPPLLFFGAVAQAFINLSDRGGVISSNRGW